MKRFTDKVVIVTGSSSGIGRGVAELFSKEGAKVTITGLYKKEVEETRDHLIYLGASDSNILAIDGDITSDEVQNRLIEETVKKFGKLDILINNVGGIGPQEIGPNGEFVEAGMKNYDYVMNLNLRSILTLTRLAMPDLIKSHGEVVMVSSICGMNYGIPAKTHYAISKAALNQMMRAMAVQYIKEGVRINSVNPGAILTPIYQQFGWTEQEAEKMVNKLGADKKLIPAGRCGFPSDIANAIAFLADHSVSSYIVGHCLVVDGGAAILNPLVQTDFNEYK